MVHIRTSTEIVLSLIDFFRTAQPLLDTKPGSAARDVTVDGPATQIARLYEELRSVVNLQSLRLAAGAELDKLALNFGAKRQSGGKATGPALLSFNVLAANIAITKGDIIRAKNGGTFVVQNSKSISSMDESTCKAVAAKYRSDLDFVGISDQYATEVLVESTFSGISGNISKYSLTSTDILNVNNVTNVFPFSGGRDSEDDATFRGRVLAIFGGANTGTSLGYRNAAMSDKSVSDALVIVAGDDLMTRDGTIVYVAENGTRTIISEGTGGKVDVIILGTRLQEITDSYIYRDLSNTGDPTNMNNVFVLGQIDADVGKTVARKRLDDLKTGVLPDQPVNNIVSVSGSLSGNNFVEKSTDEWGRVTGNYELIYNTGAFAGSPWGFDKLHWISDRIEDLKEDITKGTFNGQDALSFTDVTEVADVKQNISVVNENSTVVEADRSMIQLAHYPVNSVTRVFNVSSGERYVVANQTPDDDGSINTTGRIQISGQTLPSKSDVLQVDYTWILSYDKYFDFDSRLLNNNPRTVQNSIDWGLSNMVRRERVTLMTSGSFLTATVSHPASSVLTVNRFRERTTKIEILSGELVIYTGYTVENVISITRVSDGAELWNTSDDDGSFSGRTIYLPTDTVGEFDQSCNVVYNGTDLYNATVQGSFNDKIISIEPSSHAVSGIIVECTYIANVSTLLPSTVLSSLPAIRANNAFDTSVRNNIGTQPTTHIFDAFGLVESNLRQAPSNLALTISGSISAGTITITGTTMYLVADAIFTASRDGLTHNLSSAIKSYLGLSSEESVPANVKVSRITNLERVQMSDDELVVMSVLDTYDVKGYKIQDNSFVKDESVQDLSLTATEITFTSTPDNTANAPQIGDKIRISFHITMSDDTENVSFSKAGTLYTQKIFALADVVAISSGFTSSSSPSATLTINNMNQPATKARYKAGYDYLAPKPNERITILYNQNKLIPDVTLAIEKTRPVNADVLAKSATPIFVDVTMYIVVTKTFTNSPDIVRQNVQDAITSAVNQSGQTLGSTLDQSDLINAAYTVTGLDRARMIYFNIDGKAGSTLSVVAQENEYIVANTIIIEVETR